MIYFNFKKENISFMSKKLANNILKLMLAMALVISISGCGRMIKWVAYDKIIGPTLWDGVDELLEMRNYNVLKKGLGGDIILIALLAELSKDNIDLLSQAALGYVAYGLMHEDDEYWEISKQLYLDARKYGQRALSQNKKFREGLAKGIKIHKLVHHIKDKKYVPALMWTSFAMGLQMMKEMDDPMAMIEAPDLIALVDRANEIDPDYKFGVGTTFKAAYYAIVPKMLGLGGGPESSLREFTKVYKKNNSDGSFFLNEAFRARYLCTLHKNEEEFKEILNKILNTDSSVLKGGYLLNEIGKVKARTFLKDMDEYF